MTYGPRRAPGVSGIATAILHANPSKRAMTKSAPGLIAVFSNYRRFDPQGESRCLSDL